MTLLLILLGLAIIVGVARYNENDSLFWKLLVCFIGGFASACVVINLLKEDRSKDNLEQVTPTQTLLAPEQVCDTLLAIFEMPTTTDDVEHQKSASQDNSLATPKVVSASSEVSSSARDQPFKFYDTS